MSPAEIEVECFNVCELATQPAWQVRKKLDAGTIDRYASIFRAEGVLPPLEIARIEGALFVVDGWHRLEAAKLAGLHQLDCKVVATDPAEAMWRAARANLEHGLPLKKEELRAVLKAFVKTGKNCRRKRLMSYREIAKAALNGALPHTTVRRWVMQDFPSLAERMHDEARKGYSGAGPTWKLTSTCPALIAHQHLDSFLALLPTLPQGVRDALEQRLEDHLNPPKDHAFF